jgi:hypothetical protein
VKFDTSFVVSVMIVANDLEIVVPSRVKIPTFIINFRTSGAKAEAEATRAKQIADFMVEKLIILLNCRW